MRLTQSEDLSTLVGKADHHYDLFDGMFDWCHVPPSVMREADSSVNIKLLNTFGNYTISMSIHYKRLKCTEQLGDFVNTLRYQTSMIDKDRYIKRYLASEFGYYELLSDTYRVVDANLILGYGNATMLYELVK